MAINITRQPQSACVAPNEVATFTINCTGDVASYSWQYSADLTTWVNIGPNSNTLQLLNVQLNDSRTFYRCQIKDSTNNAYVYSAVVELFVFDENFVKRVIKGGEMFLAMVDVYTSIHHQTTADISGVINQIQAALNQKSSVDHIHDSRYYKQDQSDDRYLISASISGREATFTYGDGDTIEFTTQDTTYTAGTGLSLSGNEFSHPTSGVEAGTYKSVTVNTLGHVTSGSNPTTVAGYGITDAYTKAEVDEIFADLIDSAPDTLDTLKELANALDNDPNYATTIATALSKKLDKTSGIASLSASGTTITYTKGDGTTTGTIDTQDERVKTEVRSASDKVYLTGTTSGSTTTGTLKIDSDIYMDTVAGKLHVTNIEASNITGTVSGKASEAGTSDKLNTNAGSSIQPIYFANGVPVACSYSLNKTVPSDAKFTDTTYSIMTGASASASGSAGLVPAPSSGDQTKFLRADRTWTEITPTLIGAQAAGSYAASNHTHNYAGSSSSGGPADSANKLNTNAGSSTQPVYFANGIPVSTTYSLNKSVPSDAKFTDTTYNEFTAASSNAAGSSGLVPAPSAGDQTKFLRADRTWTAITPTLIGAQVAGSYAASNHTHNYAGSSSSGGAATSANKLNTNAGSATQPVYFANGVPVATTYSLNKSVPSDAKFTDTTYDAFRAASVYTSGSSGLVPAPPKRNNDFTRYLDESGNWTVPAYAGNGLEGTINFWDDGDYGQYQINVAFGGNGNANTVAHSDHTHNYAGSSSSGGPADSANKLNTNAGSSTQPIYFANGVPVACSYSLNKSVPSDAKFTDTDTNTWRPVQNNLTSTSTTDALSAAQGKALNDGKVSKSGDTMTGVLYASVRTSGTVDSNYYHRNIAYGTTETPTADATYGGSGSIYMYYT